MLAILNVNVLDGPPAASLVPDKDYTLRVPEWSLKEPRFLIASQLLYTSLRLPTSRLLLCKREINTYLVWLLSFWIFPNYFIILEAGELNVNIDILNHYAVSPSLLHCCSGIRWDYPSYHKYTKYCMYIYYPTGPVLGVGNTKMSDI